MAGTTIARWKKTVAAGLAAAGFAAPALLLPLAARAADEIRVVMNQARIIKLARPADTVVVGNADIADATVQDSTTIVLTGKGFGVTNLVVFDAQGRPVVDEQVVVSRQAVDSVRVYRRSDVQTLSCTPYCESAYKSEAELISEREMGR